MDKVFEALRHLLPEDSVKEVSEAVASMLADAKKEIESEFGNKLEEAYADLANELSESEKTAEKGYQEAWGIIQDLRNRLETQKEEFEAALEEGYEEAYQMLQGEKQKNDNIAAELYEEYDKRLSEMKTYIVEKVDEFLKYQGSSIYEQARRDVLNDPRMAEHKVALDKIVDIAVGYASDEDFTFANNSKLEEMSKNIDQMRSQVRLLEGRNVKLSTENTKLSEQVRAASEVITEARQYNMNNSRKERTQKAKNASGRGNLVTEGYIPEHRGTNGKVSADNAINEHTSPELYQMQVLAGVKQAN
jgi:regulator of replication initiation timing